MRERRDKAESSPGYSTQVQMKLPGPHSHRGTTTRLVLAEMAGTADGADAGGLGRTVGAEAASGSGSAAHAGSVGAGGSAGCRLASRARAGGCKGTGPAATCGWVCRITAKAVVATNAAATARAALQRRRARMGFGNGAGVASSRPTTRSVNSAGGSCAGHCVQGWNVIYASHSGASNSRSFSRARNSRVLTVGSATPSTAAISVIVSP